MKLKLVLTPYLFLLAILVFISTSCKKDLEDEKTFANNKSIESYLSSNKLDYTEENGIYVHVWKPVYNYQIAKGDTVSFWYVGHTLDGLVFDTNEKSIAKEYKLDTLVRSFTPLKVIAGSGNLIEGLDNGLLLLRDSIQATIFFPSSMGFGDNAIGPIPIWTPLAYQIQIISVNGKAIQEEKSYIEELNLISSGYTRDSSGLYIKNITLGTISTAPSLSDTIYGQIKGLLPDGTVFEDKGAQSFVLSKSDMPEGVKLGFLLTNNGGENSLLLPSYLGFGVKGSGTIKPYQTLYYQIKIDSIK